MNNQTLFNNMAQTLQKIKTDVGMETFEDSSRFTVAIANVQIRSEETQVKNLLRIAICDLNAFTRLKKAKSDNSSLARTSIAQEMAKNYKIHEEIATGVIECIAVAAGFQPTTRKRPAHVQSITKKHEHHPKIHKPTIEKTVEVVKPTIEKIVEAVPKKPFEKPAIKPMTYPKRPILEQPKQILKRPETKPEPLKRVAIEPIKTPTAPARTSGGFGGFAGAGAKRIVYTVGSKVQFGKHEWIVLDVQMGKALLLTSTVVDKRKYHDQYRKTTWADSTLRQHLNGVFLNSFSDADKERIIKTTVMNNSNSWYGTDGGENIVDKVFLLSIEETVKYFGDSGQLRQRPTNKAYWINDQHNASRIAKDSTGSVCWWWLRSPGVDSMHAARVLPDGYILINGIEVIMIGAGGGGIRPAIWVKT
ncbi:MAG: DUF6273 domain-containing protein [Turicibacter sp.]|nr:DUF6273 domain-containing protein [Turicibacter sp.]